MWWHGELVKLRYFNNKWWQYVEVRWCIKLCWGSASVQMLNSGPTRSGLLIFTITSRLHFNPLHLLNNLLTSLLIFWTELLPSSSSDTQESQSYFFFSFFFWEVTTLSVSTLAPTVCSVFPPPLPIVSLFNYLASLFSSALITLHSLSLYFYLFFFFFSFCIHPVRHSLLLSLCSLSCLFPLLHSTHGEAKPKKLSGYVLLSVRCRVGAH